MQKEEQVSFLAEKIRQADAVLIGGGSGLSRTVPLQSEVINAVRTPECTHSGLGSFHFARRYFENRVFFLFLRLLRCFSSPGSLRTPMDSVHGD